MPKKSNPRRESPGLFCFGGATGCEGFGAACAPGISVVLGLIGGAGASSSKKLTDCRCAGAGRGTLDAARCDADRSSFAFSWTTANGYPQMSEKVKRYADSPYSPHPRRPRHQG